jgi:hypothetical protein
MTRPPPFSDQDAVADWAYAELEEAWSEVERQHYLRRWDQHPGIPASEIYQQMERDAIAKAQLGDFTSLVDLLRPEHPFNETPLGRPISAALLASRSALALIASRLAGTFKVRRGRRKMTQEERRAKAPVHDAADDVAAIMAILRKGYPKQSAAQIRDLALHAVSRQHGIEVRTLYRYLDRPAADRRRL